MLFESPLENREEMRNRINVLSGMILSIVIVYHRFPECASTFMRFRIAGSLLSSFCEKQIFIYDSGTYRAYVFPPSVLIKRLLSFGCSYRICPNKCSELAS